MLCLIMLLYLLCCTSASYEVIGESSRRPLQSDCFFLSQNCKECIKLGCFYYMLSPVLNKSLCFPGHTSPPNSIRFLIEKSYVDEKYCPAQDITESTTDSTTTTTISPEKKTKESSYNIVIISIIVILVIVILLTCIILCCKMRNRNRGNAQSSYMANIADIPLGIM